MPNPRQDILSNFSQMWVKKGSQDNNDREKRHCYPLAGRPMGKKEVFVLFSRFWDVSEAQAHPTSAACSPDDQTIQLLGTRSHGSSLCFLSILKPFFKSLAGHGNKGGGVWE